MRGRWLGASRRTPLATTPRRSTTVEDERRLIFGWRAGDPQAGQDLIKAYLPFVVTIAFEYRKWGVSLDDVIQQGCLGLLRACLRFDPAQEARLVTYAAYWIRAEIRDYVLRSYRMVRLGTTKEDRKALRWYRATLENHTDRLSEVSGLSRERVEALLPMITSADASFDASADGGVPLHEKLTDDVPSPEEATIQSLDGQKVRTALLHVIAQLSAREQVIARERWLEEPPTTLEALGLRLGVTKERVRQIEDRTRQKVKARLIELKVA
jgi:RNA polymerase sigma-32 factor